MLTNRPSFTDGVQTAWDATSLELFQTCPRKYFYRMILNISARHKSVHLIFGGVYAKALETFYIYRAEGDTIDQALRRVVHEALHATWINGTPIDFDHNAKTRFNLIRSIVWYIDQFGDESEAGITTYHLASGKPAVELSFMLELPSGDLWCGHIDRVVEYAGAKWWMDQKTTGSTITPRFFEGFKPHNQFYGYTWAGQSILGTPLRGGIIDAAQIAVGFTRFERSPITVTQQQISEWLENAMQTIEEAKHATREHNFRMNLSACGNYGGCEYRTLCSRCPSIRDKFIEGDYVHPEPWEPAVPR